MFNNLKRIWSFAVNDFSRNMGISIAAIFVLVVTIMLVTGLLFFHGITEHLISQIKNKIDITAYFKDGTKEQDILNVKEEILQISPNIKNVEYISKDQALVFFNEKHKDDSSLMQALQDVGENPFLPSLNIITNGDPLQYASISNILQTSSFSESIEKVDFSQKRETIEKVYLVTQNINIFGLILGFILVVIAALVVFNTIKLVIENSKEEIGTMKIVGASDKFIQGPFVIQGIIYGIISFIICIFLSGLFAYFTSSKIESILPGFSVFDYFLANWWIFILIQLGFGMGVGAISALVVVKRHLNV